jgi:hypothetical protein
MNDLVVRLWGVFGVLAIGLSSVWLMPSQEEMKPSLLSTELPRAFNNWQSEKRSVSQAELTVLSSDTEFERRFYRSSALEGFAGVEVSFVFSGRDLNNSIHRPERCLRTQGWNFLRERSLVIPNVFADGSGLPVREIVCVRPRVRADGEAPPLNKFGEPIYDKRIQYYTFFGAEKIVSGHYERTFADIEARLLKGYDQQWAYATFSVPVTSVYKDQGFNIPDAQVFDEEQSALVMQDFIRELLPQVVNSERLAVE